MNTVTIDLIGDRAVNIGASYKVQIQLCNAPDLATYTGGSCQIKSSNTSDEVILSPTINVLSKDVFEIDIPFNLFTSVVLAGTYVYDVLFSKADHKFYAIAGKIQLIKRVTVG